MLGRYVKVKVTSPMYSMNKRFGCENKLNYGIIESGAKVHSGIQGAYIMGINHPVRNFEGRVIAVIRRYGSKGVVWVVAPKSSRYIIHDIKKSLSFSEKEGTYDIECLYERSCGAIVYRDDGERKILLIKNKRSSHWGFPKGHIEYGETEEETAIRETKEETGIDIDIVDGFSCKSEYTIQGKVEKAVIIFIGKALNTHVKIQETEIDEFYWATIKDAEKMLKFDNDRNILSKAVTFFEEEAV